jgi:Flp pilus assembly protein TadD
MNIPPMLVEAVRDQRVVLFFGSGANFGASHPGGNKIPLGDALRDLICDKFFGGAMKAKPLTAVSAMAANDAGLIDFQRYIHDLLQPFGPAAYHWLLPKFRWRAVATTNYDMIVERAYDATSKRLQNIVSTVKDLDQLDHRLALTTNPVAYFKLHGSIDHHTDSTIPLILSNEQYAGYENNRRRMWGRLRDLAYEYPVVFVGYSISDPHVQRILFDLTDKTGRPMFYSISPDFEDPEVRYWSSHRVACLKGTFEEFLTSLDAAIPSTARALPSGLGGGTLSIRGHYRVASASESTSLVAYLEKDVSHVFSGMTATPQDPREFYRGNDTGWGCIQQNLDVRRAMADSVLVDAILSSEDAARPTDLFMLKGPAGNGKSVALKRIAWEAAVTYEQLVLFANSAAALRLEPLEEIYALTGKRILLCVDHVALYRHELNRLIGDSRHRKIPITILGSERDNEWFTYCDQLEPYLKQEFPVRYLNEREIDQLIGLLDRHNALGLLKAVDHAARVYAFAQSAERQLLVALHEVTLGVPFEEIVLDEFNRIEPSIARQIYLSICALHQFGAPVRAGLISRTSGVSFNDFQAKFLEPLQNVVHIIEDRHTGDLFYRSRHQHVAEIVFRRALPTQEDKFDLLSDVVGAINVGYSSDRESFSRVIKGRAVAEIFASADLGRLFYDRILETSPDDAFVYHQRAVFEMQHAGGSLVLAEAAARKAFELNPNSRGIRHTQGEIARRQANATDDPLRKEAFRRITREKISGDTGRMSEYDLHTKARLSIDELREELANDQAGGEEPSKRFVEAVRDAETTIQRGLQLFPESSELLADEAAFRDVLDQTAAAQAALEKAFRLNPRQDWLAVRLARRYEEAGDFERARVVLDKCLHDNPSSKAVHFAKGRNLIQSNGAGSDILANLKRSFSEGDNNYEAQFWFARELFAQGDFEAARKTFAAIHERAPGRFRNAPAARLEDATGCPLSRSGRIARLEEGYAFVQANEYPENLFASKADTNQLEWVTLRSGAAVAFNVAFNRRGPLAISLAAAR